MNNPYEIRFKLTTFSVHDNGAPADGKTYRNGVPLCDAESSAKYARAVYNTLDADKEHFSVLALNNKNRVIGYKVISTGSLTASLVHPREVFRAAMFLDAAALILAHNHPSGDPAPSQEDIQITKRLKDGADIFGLRILDHIILGDGRFYSFSDHGLI